MSWRQVAASTEDLDLQLALHEQYEEDYKQAETLAGERNSQEKNQEDIVRDIVETEVLETSLYCTGRMSCEAVNFIHIPQKRRHKYGRNM